MTKELIGPLSTIPHVPPGEVANSLIRIMQAIEPISKGKTNKAQGYAYRGIDDICTALQPIFAKEGVILLPKVLKVETKEAESKSGGVLYYKEATVEYMFIAKDGSSLSAVLVGEGMDTSDKATNKAMSSALKYLLMQTFLIPTEEKKDSEEDSHEVTPRGLGMKLLEAIGLDNEIAAIDYLVSLGWLRQDEPLSKLSEQRAKQILARPEDFLKKLKGDKL